MKDLIESVDLILDALRKGDTTLAGVLLLALKARLIARRESGKVSRQMGTKKRELIEQLKKMKL